MPHSASFDQIHSGTTQSGRPDLITLAAFAGTALFGAGNAVAIRLGYAELAPFWGAAVRFLLLHSSFLRWSPSCGWRCRVGGRLPGS